MDPVNSFYIKYIFNTYQAIPNELLFERSSVKILTHIDKMFC